MFFSFLAYVFLFAIPSYLLGVGILSLFRREDDRSAGFFLSAALGTGALGQIFYLVLLFFHVNRWIWGMVIGLIFISGFRYMLGSLRGLLGKISILLKRKYTGEKIFFLFFLMIFIVVLPGIVTPPVFFDALERHLSFAHRYLVAGHFYPIRETILSAIPQLLQMDFASLLLFRVDGAVKWIHFQCFLLTVLGTYQLGKTVFNSRNAGLIAALMWAALPKAMMTTTLAGVDMGLVLFDIAAFLILFKALEKKSISCWTICLIGIFSGLAVSVKYTGLLSMILLLVMILFTRRGSYRHAVLFLGVSLMVSSPWWGKNLFYYNNPLYPFFENVLHPGNTSVIDALRLLQNELAGFGSFGHEPVWVSRVLSLVRVHFYSRPYDGWIGIIFFMTIPMLALRGPVPSRFRWVIVYVAGYILFWISTTTQLRFLLPVCPFIALLGAGGVEKLKLQSARTGKILWPALALGILFQICFFVHEEQHYFHAYTYLLRADREAYLARHTRVYPVLQRINALAGPNDRVLFMGESRGYGLGTDYVSPTRFDRHPLPEWVHNAGTPDRLLELFREKHLRFILVDTLKWRRMEKSGTFRWSKPGDRRIFTAFWNEHTRFLFNKYPYLLLSVRY